MEYQSENKICQNCKNDFTIEPDDFSFYEKIKVPPPTFCPECRMIRRLRNRNERVLFKTHCSLCNKSIFTIYHPDNDFTIYCLDCYLSDKWDAKDYAQDYDFSKSFFEQFLELQKRVPKRNLHQLHAENSDYSNYVLASKDIYLSFTSTDSNWIYYSRSADRSKECMDCYNIIDSEALYECIQVSKSYGSTNLAYSNGCVDSHFLYDCNNCTDCFMSSNLRNKSYVFRNKQLTQEEYKENIKKEKLNSRNSRINLKKEFTILLQESIHKYAMIEGSVNVSGDAILRSKNVKNSFHAIESEDCKYVMRTVGLKNSYDVFGSLVGELLYEVHGGAKSSHNSHFVAIGNGIVDSEYTDFCVNSKDLFACISLNNAQYCILNKQYTKEEYFEMVEKIKRHMDKMPHIDSKGRIFKYGEYFPQICIPFAYNESAAQEYFPLTKEEILERGYLYREDLPTNHNFTLSADKIPDILDENICDEILECAHKKDCLVHRCIGVYKITENELLFYKKFNLPIPNLCHNCRHYERLKLVHLPELYSRECMCEKENHNNHTGKCEIEFETSYAPDRPEIVYCEKCYQQEVY